MAKQPVVEIRAFPGLQTNTDPRDREPGVGEKQINVYSVKPGQADPRGGMRRITFED